MKNFLSVSLLLTTLFISLPVKAQFSIFHPVRSLENVAVLGAVSYVAIKGTTDYLLAHPEKLSEFLSTHPDKIEPLNSYVDKKIETAKTQQEQDKYINFKNQLSLGVNESQATAIENDPDWQAIRQDVESAIVQTDAVLVQNNKIPQQCDIQVVKQLLLPHKEFESNVNISLPKKQSVPNQATLLDVNTFKQLKANYKKTNNSISLQQDHIPSFAAIDLYFNNHGIKTKTVGEDRDIDLEKNETAIAVPDPIHKLGRTYGGKNKPLKNLDSSDLLFATIKDITTTAYGFNKNPQYNVTVADYIQSAMYIYARNKILCMYDVK